MSKLQEALDYSNKRGAERAMSIRTMVTKDEAWEDSCIVECPECGQPCDLCNPAIKKDGECVCGFKLLRADGKPVQALRVDW